MRWWLVVSLVGCGGEVEVQPRSLPAHEAAHAEPDAPQPATDPALLVQHRQFGEQATAALDRCAREVVSKLPERAPGSPPPLSVEELEAACGEVALVAERWMEPLLGVSRDASKALGGLVRVGEDVRMLARSLRRRETGALIDGTVKHLADSVPEVLPVAEALREVGAVVDERQIERGVRDPAVLRERVARMVSNDRHDVAGLVGAFRNFGHAQASGDGLVRAPLLRYFGQLAELRLQHKRAQLLAYQEDAGEPERAMLSAALRYLELADAAVATYRHAERTMCSEQWGGREGADRLLVELETSVERWREGWSAQLVLLGEPAP